MHNDFGRAGSKNLYPIVCVFSTPLYRSHKSGRMYQANKIIVVGINDHRYTHVPVLSSQEYMLSNKH